MLWLDVTDMPTHKLIVNTFFYHFPRSYSFHLLQSLEFILIPEHGSHVFFLNADVQTSLHKPAEVNEQLRCVDGGRNQNRLIVAGFQCMLNKTGSAPVSVAV